MVKPPTPDRSLQKLFSLFASLWFLRLPLRLQVGCLARRYFSKPLKYLFFAALFNTNQVNVMTNGTHRTLTSKHKTVLTVLTFSFQRHIGLQVSYRAFRYFFTIIRLLSTNSTPIFNYETYLTVSLMLFRISLLHNTYWSPPCFPCTLALSYKSSSIYKSSTPNSYLISSCVSILWPLVTAKQFLHFHLFPLTEK